MYSRVLKSNREVHFSSITISLPSKGSEQKCKKSNRKLFTPEKWEGIFHVLFLLFDKTIKQVRDNPMETQKVEKICLKHLFKNSEVRRLEDAKEKSFL